MPTITVDICEICGAEKRSDHNGTRHWSDCVGEVLLTFKKQSGIQSEWKYDMCTTCAGFMRDVVAKGIQEIQLKHSKKDK